MTKIKEIADFGSIVKLQDGTSWEINFLHKTHTTLWQIGQEVSVIPSANPIYPHILVNTISVDCAEAKPVR